MSLFNSKDKAPFVSFTNISVALPLDLLISNSVIEFSISLVIVLKRSRTPNFFAFDFPRYSSNFIPKRRRVRAC